MLNDNIKNLILETINLYGNSNLNQAIIDEGTQKLKQAKKLLIEDNREPSSNLKDEYDNQYNIHKNDNLITKKIRELPYINREFYKHTFIPNEDVLIGFYVDDHNETYYRDEITSIYKIFMYDNHELVKVDYIHSGSQQMNFGKLAEGEHILSYEVQDIYGRKSFRDYFEIRVKEPTVKSEYIVSDNEIPTDSDSIEWLNQLILNLDEKYNYLTLPTGTYKMKFGETLALKDNLTLDLNGSEIVLEEGQAGDKGIQVNIQQCYDTHVINGTIVGDRDTHDYENSPNNSEWVNGINIEGRSKYCSYENVEVKNITGYGSALGFGYDRDGGSYCWSNMSYKGVWDRNLQCEESDYYDLSKFKVDGCNFIQVGKYLGYQGNPTQSTLIYTWYYRLQFFDENKNLLDDFNCYFYRKVFIPNNVKYCKILSIKGTYFSNTSIFAFKAPVNCEFNKVKHIDCRCVGSALSCMESVRMIDCYFTNCGTNGAKCAFDSEDGWDMMHDFYMTGTVFENNPNNHWLTCAGHNFLLENNEYKGNMYFWTRCQNYTVRNNKINNIGEGNGKPTHHARIYDNECSGAITSTTTIIKNCVAKQINGETDNCTAYSLPSTTKTVDDCNFILSNEVQYIGDISINNSTFSLADGVEARNFSFNKKNGQIKFMNCEFRGGLYNLTNHNTFNSGEFINCDFDKVAISVNCQYTDNTETIVFKNCIMPIEGYLLRFSPHAYSRGVSNVVFENCIITDLGNHKLDGYGAGSALINAFSKPVEGSSVTFKNCTIDKSVGLLLEGYGDTSNGFKLDLIFENTPLSENLQIQDKYNFKDFVNLIIK